MPTIEVETHIGIVELTAPITDLRIELSALRGPIGPEGPTGPAGDAEALAYSHPQDSPSDTWTITHNLGYRPAGILVYDSAGTQWEPGNVEHVSTLQLIITWSAPFSGIAYLS